MTWPNAVGMAGALLVVGAYLLLQTGRLAAESPRFSAINAAGAAGILFSLVYDFNPGAFAIEFFWLIISLYGIYRSLKLRRGQATDERSVSD